MMIQQPRVRTKIYDDRRFYQTASTLWNNLPSETRNEQSWKFLRKMLKLIFLELLIMILCKLLTLTVLPVFFKNFYIFIYPSPPL
jgi:hypothetical protein